MSGTGKSSVLAELGRRGYRVVDTDDPGWREYREYVESSDPVADLIAIASRPMTRS
jgi:dephospho-CoA kinase